MFRDIGNDGGKSSDFEGGMIRNGDVMLGWLCATQAHVASGLASFFVSKKAQSFCKLLAGKGPGKLHAVITSSRTK